MTHTLTEIAAWKLEAKLEDNDRYFYLTPRVYSLETGDRCYVIGRKGTGKTAISEYLHKQSAYNVFTARLSFKNYPFNELYKHANQGFAAPNQYITLWKYVIYSSILRLMAQNEAIDARVRSVIDTVFPPDPLKNLSRQIDTFRPKALKLSVFGVEAAIEAAKRSDESITSLSDRVDDLEEVVRTYIDEASYFVTFDELDEGFTPLDSVKPNETYAYLLTGLFKAVQDVKARFQKTDGYRIKPIIFLRDDIYESILDPDKSKWSDVSVSLNWNNAEIRKLLAFRISRAADPTAKTHSFQKAWEVVFGKNGTRFETVVRRTFRRPRDVIAFLQKAAEIAVADDLPFVNTSMYRSVLLPYSMHIRAELEDEMGSSLPGVKTVFDLLRSIQYRTFEFTNFDTAYRSAVKRGRVPDLDPESVLESLFRFSVVGNAPRGPGDPGGARFRYQDPFAQLDIDRPIHVHPSLQTALNLAEVLPDGASEKSSDPDA